MDLFIISQISHKRVENPKDVLSVGQDVTVKVLEVNADAERVSLSIKALEERPANAEGENNEKRQSRHAVQAKTSRKKRLRNPRNSIWILNGGSFRRYRIVR